MKSKNKRFGILFLCAVLFSLNLNAEANSTAEQDPSTLEYKEIESDQFFSRMYTGLFDGVTAYKVTNVFVYGSNVYQYNDIGRRIVLRLKSSSENYKDYPIYAETWAMNLANNDRPSIDRMDSVANNPKYNGHYTAYIYQKTFEDGGKDYVLYNLEGIPSQEQLDADNEEELAKERAAEEAKLAEKTRKDTAAKNISKGYVYHGIEEDAINSKLFEAGALEAGHAYYISTFMISAGGGTGAAVTSLFGTPTYHVIEYSDQKVRGEVVSAANTMFGKIPVGVVVAGGKSPMFIPKVLGLIK